MQQGLHIRIGDGSAGKFRQVKFYIVMSLTYGVPREKVLHSLGNMIWLGRRENFFLRIGDGSAGKFSQVKFYIVMSLTSCVPRENFLHCLSNMIWWGRREIFFLRLCYPVLKGYAGL